MWKYEKRWQHCQVKTSWPRPAHQGPSISSKGIMMQNADEFGIDALFGEFLHSAPCANWTVHTTTQKMHQNSVHWGLEALLKSLILFSG